MIKRITALVLAVFFLISVAATASAAVSFTDVKPTKWYYKDVIACAEKGFVSGTGNGKFQPDLPLTRAMFVTILGKFAGIDEKAYTSSPFRDVKKSAWYAPFVAWAAANHITEGVGDGKFAPDTTLTREQLAAMICRYLDFCGDPVGAQPAEPFSDQKQISKFARDAALECAFAGIMSGVGNGVFAPKKTATRAEICSVVNRLYAYCTEDKTMDVYFVAGQSNAAGHAKAPTSDAGVAAELQKHPEYQNGFEGVYYYGCTNTLLDCDPVAPVRIGLGSDLDMFGPEIGMAEILSGEYAKTERTDACIVRFAVDGTSLLNRYFGEENWTPPSVLAQLRRGQIAEESGILYRYFLEVAESSIDAIHEAGYKRIRVMGMYWMQGESDVSSKEDYAAYLPYLISDFRTDLSAVMGQNLSAMPFLIGEIALNYNGSRSTANRDFVEMQNTVAESVSNCYIVKNAEYPVDRLGGDRYHWGFYETIKIGRSVGMTLYDASHEIPCGKTMDLYFVAGQSNAAGHAQAPTENEDVQAVLAQHPEYQSGIPGVYYFGCTDFVSEYNPIEPVRIGFGSAPDMFGPEIGIAQALSSHYEEDERTDACIVKFALDGSTLINKYGGPKNWTSPSMLETIKRKYIHDGSGYLYQYFIETAKASVDAIWDAGYQRVRVMGLYWMQGETDIYDCEQYAEYLTFLIRDVRADLSEITGQNLEKMPFLIGEIAENYNGGVSDGNLAFINLQNTIAADVNDCYIVKNGQYPVNGVGGDRYHWGFFEALEIGRNVGKIFADASLVPLYGKTMDIYLIAGQSNAAGFTQVPRENEDVARVLAEHPEYENGFDDVYYYGALDQFDRNVLEPVRIGLGFQNVCMGPEVGMAEGLRSYYAEKPLTDVCIVKYAAGGTSLLTRLKERESWTSPSAIASLRPTQYSENSGKLYLRLLTVFQNALEAIRDAGYTRVRVMGMYWMQGEGDNGLTADYRKIFPYFVSDIRADLTRLSGQDLTAMPILIGEISENYGEYYDTNRLFIAMQRELAEELPNCYIIGNSQYPVNGVGGDSAHWGFFEMLNVGRDIADCILEKILS